VAVTSGNVSRLVWGETGLPSVVIYRQDTHETAAHASRAATEVPAAVGATDATHGGQVYARTCSACHGPAGEGLTGPSIKSIGGRLSVEEIAAWIMNPVARKDSSGAMPKLFPSVLTQQDVFDAAAYVAAL
jgi:mono/diheme cytochrome c family protein